MMASFDVLEGGMLRIQHEHSVRIAANTPSQDTATAYPETAIEVRSMVEHGGKQSLSGLAMVLIK